MKKILALFITVYFSFSNVGPVYLAAGTTEVNKIIDEAFELKESGDTEGAVNRIQRWLTVNNTVDSFVTGTKKDQKDNIYTERFLKILIEYLKADEIDYSILIKKIATLAEEIKDNFNIIAKDLKDGYIPKQNYPLIKSINNKISRAMVLHSFCVAPKKYQRVYESTQEALFFYSRAWKMLDELTNEAREDKNKLIAKAMINLKKGNELLSQSSSLMKSTLEQSN